MADWEYLSADDYRSPQFDELHARLENYQIYSLVWCDHEAKSSITDYAYGLLLPDVKVLSGLEFSQQTIVTIASLGLNVNGSFSDGFYEIYGYKVFGRTTPAGTYPYPVFDFFQIDDRDDPNGLQAAAAISNGYTVIFTEPFVRVDATAYPQVQTIVRTISADLFSFFPDVRNRQPTVTTSNGLTQVLEHALAVAFQSYNPSGLIPFDFSQLANNYPVKASKRTVYFSREIGSFTIPPSSPPELKIGAPNYIDLITGFSLDNRSISVIEATATSTRTIKFGCYCRNPYESHPRLLHSLDWRTGEIDVTAGKRYRLPIKEFVLGTLVVDAVTKGELLNSTVSASLYPYKYLFKDDLADLFLEWSLLFSDPPDNQLVYPLASTYTSTTLDETGNQTILTFSKTIYTFKTIVRVMAGNNDLWGHGSITIPQNRPPNNHAIFSFNHQNLFELPQLDGSYGSYMTDSPRVLEIWTALDAGKYASYLDANGAVARRVANLGHLIEKTANFLGYRPDPNGTIDESKESSTYARKEIDPKKPFPTGEYLAGRFGTKGMLMKRLPNKATATGWAPGGMVAVHDIPQMVAEMFDQTNTALNLQESTSIQIRDGGDLYKYPNQLSLLMEIATGQIQQRRQVREIWASSVVTQNTVNEVIGGLGLPTVSKSISINNQLIPYWGIQPSASLQREIATVGQNVGNVQGQIL
jgi:hypothetical protein